ncbi:MAG: hypothetical protein QGG17_08960, partial [Rhodospirillales bacterium]|nr:hypothetical protein [Rhodospirillales bacterium]
KGSNERPSSTGACNTATPLLKIINRVSQSLHYFGPHPVSNYLTTDTPQHFDFYIRISVKGQRNWDLSGKSGLNGHQSLRSIRAT